MPYLFKRSIFGVARCVLPQLTNFLGPAVDDGDASAANRLIRRDTIVRELLKQLPSSDVFYHKMHRGVDNILIFQELGYGSNVQFTFEIPPALPSELWRNLRDKTRNVVRKAEDALRVLDCIEPEDFFDGFEHNLGESKKTLLYWRRENFVKLARASIERRRGCIFCAEGPDGRRHAAVFVVWDCSATYLMLTTRSPSAHNGAVALLIWRAILQCASMNLVFDFEGVGTVGSKVFYAGFGGAVRPRYVASRYNAVGRVVTKLGWSGVSTLKPITVA